MESDVVYPLVATGVAVERSGMDALRHVERDGAIGGSAGAGAVGRFFGSEPGDIDGGGPITFCAIFPQIPSFFILSRVKWLDLNDDNCTGKSVTATLYIEVRTMTHKPLWLVEFLITVIVLVVVGSLVVPAPSVAVTEQPAQAAVAR